MSSRLPIEATLAAADAGSGTLGHAVQVQAPPPQEPHRRLSRPMRTQVMVLSFYLIDTFFMAAYALDGVLPGTVPMAFGAAGCALTAVFAFILQRGLNRQMGGANFTTLQLLSASALMLGTSALAPQIGMLLMLTVIVALATAALQLPLRNVLVVSGLIVTVSLGLTLLHGTRFGMPLADTWSQLLSCLWFAVVLAKIAAINLIGTEMRRALSASNARLGAALAQVRELSQRDELTGLQNRRSILAMLTEERARFARGGTAFGVAILDIDHFKQVNDRLGHAMGDEVLRSFAQIVSGQLRSTDRIARYGGEEFLLLLINTPEVPLATLVAERLRSAVHRHAWSALAPDLHVTCSIGLTMSRAGEDVAEMLQRADEALYKAKSAGRNAIRMG